MVWKTRLHFRSDFHIAARLFRAQEPPASMPDLPAAKGLPRRKALNHFNLLPV
jgi:hypothetical protein